MPPRHVHGALDVPGFELVLLANVDQGDRLVGVTVLVTRIELVLDLGGVDFLDPGPDLLDQLLPRTGSLSSGHPGYPLKPFNFDPTFINIVAGMPTSSSWWESYGGAFRRRRV